jgi:hypothetical protein
MKEIPKHRIGEIFYNKSTNKCFVITDIFEHIYYMRYIPEPESGYGYNTLCSLPTGGYSKDIFDRIFKPIGDVQD